MTEELLAKLRAQANPANVAGMARYGIPTQDALGVPMSVLRRMAREVGGDHKIAAELWDSGIHEARTLATLIDDPAKVTARQMDRWAGDLDSWDVCDQACQNLFRYTPMAFGKAAQWARRTPEFVRRAGFSLMAGLAGRSLQAGDEQLAAFLPLIAEAAADDRNMVKKAVNWALRQIGKRNRRLHAMAVAAATQIGRQDSRSARWIAADALRELRNPATVARIER